MSKAQPPAPRPPPPPTAGIEIRGAREHNHKNRDVVLPRDRLTVITGLSGSGKSSLAFDTIYAEGQRRYVESLSAYARQFLEQMAKPDVDSIEGLSPAIAIEQKSVSHNPRSTVGTATEIHDYLRLLFARVGQPHCPQCGVAIASQTVPQMTDRILSLDAGTRLQILAPIVRDRKGSFRSELESHRRQGFVRARVDGETVELSEDLKLAGSARHDIDIVVDRLTASAALRGRIAQSLETALGSAGGLVRIDVGPGDDDWLLSEHSACVDCGISYPEIAPRLFSFNSPHGACPRCGGLGTTGEFDPARIVPDTSLSLARGALATFGGRRRSRYYDQLLEALAAHYGIDLDTPWQDLPEVAQHGILFGAAKDDVSFEIESAGMKSRVKRRWDGAVGELLRRFEGGNDADREELGRYRVQKQCPECGGSRLRPEARSVKIGGTGIPDVCRLSVERAAEFVDGLCFGPSQQQLADRILREIRARLRFLTDVGLSYLTLGRASATLSGGEGQRIRLATQMGSSLMGVLYILDEPSVGLHPRDNARLLAGIFRLRDLGNTVIVVEHDEATIRAADHVVDMGPGAGIHG
ncbi:MAG: excinuclease ABC subunit UvrA, partial [Myxococcota bacterium]